MLRTTDATCWLVISSSIPWRGIDMNEVLGGGFNESIQQHSDIGKLSLFDTFKAVLQSDEIIYSVRSNEIRSNSHIIVALKDDIDTVKAKISAGKLNTAIAFCFDYSNYLDSVLWYHHDPENEFRMPDDLLDYFIEHDEVKPETSSLLSDSYGCSLT